ncbi:MAG: hypothetical protein AAFN70_17020, partial [Planctomycetota bacterium]
MLPREFLSPPRQRGIDEYVPPLLRLRTKTSPRHRLKKQNGGKGIFAEIAGYVEPLPDDAERS